MDVVDRRPQAGGRVEPPVLTRGERLEREAGELDVTRRTCVARGRDPRSRTPSVWLSGVSGTRRTGRTSQRPEEDGRSARRWFRRGSGTAKANTPRLGEKGSGARDAATTLAS